MRVARIAGGVVAALVGLLALAGGLIAAFGYIGTDNVISAPARTISSQGVAITTTPEVFDYYGPRLHVTAESTQPGRQVFIGVGHHVDVESYFSGASRTEVTALDLPFSMETTEVTGKLTQVSPPNGLEWWIAKVSGPSRQELVWPMADGPYDVAILGSDGKANLDAVVTMGIELPGAFESALIVAGAGLVLLLLAALLLSFLRQKPVEEDLVLWDQSDQWEQNEYWGSTPEPTHRAAPLGDEAFNGPPWGPPPAAESNGMPPGARVPVGPPLDPHTGQPAPQPAPPEGPQQGPPVQQPPPAQQPAYQPPPPPPPAPHQRPPQPQPQPQQQQPPPQQRPRQQPPPSGPPPSGPLPWRPAGPPRRAPAPPPAPERSDHPQGDDHGQP